MALIGMFLAQIRGLRNYSYLSSTAVFQNVIICIIVASRGNVAATHLTRADRLCGPVRP